jgi:hypothetical protein
MEKILKIEEGVYDGYEGVRITTNKQTVLFGISAGQDCCENYGYMSSNDDFSEFIGAEILDIKETNSGLESSSIVERMSEDYIQLGSTFFITVETTVGTLQFAVYNEHNGYYGHDVIVRSEQLSEDFYL